MLLGGAWPVAGRTGQCHLPRSCVIISNVSTFTLRAQIRDAVSRRLVTKLLPKRKAEAEKLVDGITTKVRQALAGTEPDTQALDETQQAHRLPQPALPSNVSLAAPGQEASAESMLEPEDLAIHEDYMTYTEMEVHVEDGGEEGEEQAEEEADEEAAEESGEAGEEEAEEESDYEDAEESDAEINLTPGEQSLKDSCFNINRHRFAEGTKDVIFVVCLWGSVGRHHYIPPPCRATAYSTPRAA